jgi:hypothetical protein
MLRIDDGLVSWRGGAIYFWSRSAKPRKNTIGEAHQGRVCGVLAVDRGLISYGEDGAVHCWSRRGKRRAGGDSQAHKMGVNGMLVMGETLVSWGNDDTVCFWSRRGKLMFRQNTIAHADHIKGMVVTDDGLMSWSGNGTICRWLSDKWSCQVAWIAPAPLECVASIDGELWVGMMGRPHRLTAKPV